MMTFEAFAAFAALLIGLGGITLAAAILRAAGQKAPERVKIRVTDGPPRR